MNFMNLRAVIKILFLTFKAVQNSCESNNASIWKLDTDKKLDMKI